LASCRIASWIEEFEEEEDGSCVKAASDFSYLYAETK